jgi:hypothetical protein
MSIIPCHELTIDQRKEFRAASVSYSIQQALSFGVVRNREELNVRDILASDFSKPDFSVPPAPEGVWLDWIKWFSPDKVVVIYKILVLSVPTISEISVGNITTTIHSMEAIYAGFPTVEHLAMVLMDPTSREVLNRMIGKNSVPMLGFPMEGYFNEPFFIPPGQILGIKLKVKKGDTPGYVVPIGYVVEKK